MLKEKKNPIYELQKKLISERIVLGNIDEENNVESNDKIYYDILENIYNEGKKTVKKNNKTKNILMIIIGFASGTLIMFLLKIFGVF